MEPSTSNESRHTAVIWIDPALPAPFELLTALAGRGIHSVRVSSPYMGVAEICRIYRARQRERPDKPLNNVLALVVVNPEKESRTCAVCEALERYAGGTPCWMYGPAEAPKLRPISESDRAAFAKDAAPAPAGPTTERGGKLEPIVMPGVSGKGGANAPPPPPLIKLSRQPREVASPQLRLAGDAPMPPPPPAPKGHDRKREGEGGVLKKAGGEERDEGKGEEAESSRSVLTPEELAMLLGDDDGEGGTAPR